MAVVVQVDAIYMDWTVTTQCSMCNETNSTDWFNSTFPPQHIYPLSETQVVKELNPSLDLVPKCAYFIWYIIGIPANCIAFLVWIQGQMINSSGCYMVALALTDNIFLILHGIIHVYLWFPSTNILNYPVMCQVLPMFYTAVQYMSGLLVLEFTVEQYIAICYPFRRSHYCRVSIAKKVILGGVVLVILLGAPQAYFFTLSAEAGNQCTVRSNILKGDAKSVWAIWTWTTEMVMFGAVPLTCLMFNIRVIYEVTRQADVQLVRHYSRSSRSSIRQSRKHGTTTVMLLAVSLYWVCTEIPATVVLGLNETYKMPYITSIAEAEDNADLQRFMSYRTVRTIIEVMSFSRYSCKLFIYLATGTQFRKQLGLFNCSRRFNRQSNDTTITSVAARTTLCKRNTEKVKLLNISNGKVTLSESAYSRNSTSQTDSPATDRESWPVEPPTELSTLQDEPPESGTILNNNYKFH